ncbi:MAG: hypothetical protein H0W74_08375 [Sphingosinicella sp.]|nr:hypothetical protein [Sphingosinicella sp.]
MTDNRDPDPVSADPTPHHTTTVVHTEPRSGGGGIAIAVLILLILFLLFVFREDIFGAAESVEKVDVQVTTNGN